LNIYGQNAAVFYVLLRKFILHLGVRINNCWFLSHATQTLHPFLQKQHDLYGDAMPVAAK